VRSRSRLPLRTGPGVLLGFVLVLVVVVAISPVGREVSRVVPSLLLVIPVVLVAVVSTRVAALATAGLAAMGVALYLPPIGSPPDVEWRLVAALLDRAGYLVPREELTKAGWPDRVVSESALNVTVKRVRRRLAPLGLSVTTVRDRGFVLSTRLPSKR
jgi:hypothetical protein